MSEKGENELHAVEMRKTHDDDPCAARMAAPPFELREAGNAPLACDDAVRLHAGDAGPAQLSQWAVTSIAQLPLAFATLSWVFILPLSPKVRCTPDEATGCAALAADGEDGLFAPTGDAFCALPAGSWRFHEPRGSATAAFSLVCHRAHWVPALGMAYFAGVVVGAPAVGMLADARGRRLAFVSTLAATSFLMAVLALCPGPRTFAAVQLATGAAAGGMGVTAFVLGQECLPPRHRELGGACTMGMFAVGELLLAAVAWGFGGADYSQMLLALAAAAAALVPVAAARSYEPISWHLARPGGAKDALQALGTIAKLNGRPPPPPELRIAEADAPSNAGVAELLSPAAGHLRLHTVIMLTIWGICSVVYYGLAAVARELGSDPAGSFAAAAAAELPANAGAYFGLRGYGRRPVLVAALGGCAAAMLGLSSHASGPAALWAAGGRFCVTVAFTTAYICASELFPTQLRAAGLGLCDAAARVFGLAAPYVAGAAPGMQPVLFAALAAKAAALAALLPETRGCPLPTTVREAAARASALQRLHL